MNIIINNALIVNPDKCFPADIIIKNGLIKAFESPQSIAPKEGFESIDAAKKYLIPGGVDPHVHLALPTPAGKSADDFISGGKAALAGGVTHIIDFVTPIQDEKLTDAFLKREEEAKDCPTNIMFHMGISGIPDQLEQQMEICVKELGIKSFKAYLAYRNHIGVDYQGLEKIMKSAAKLGAIVLVHAEDDEAIECLKSKHLSQNLKTPKYHALSRPAVTESMAVDKVLDLVRKTHCTTYFVHISSAVSANALAAAKKEGLPIYAETCPQYLLFDDTVYNGNFEETAPFVFSPPAREKWHKEALWQHVKDHTFDVIATDHCPFSMKQKKLGENDFTKIPNGAGGLEFRIPLMHHFGVTENGLSLSDWIKLCSSNAANIFDFGPQKGITLNTEACFSLFDPTKEYRITKSEQTQACDINIFENIKIRGQVEKNFTKTK